ncbi:oxidation resistance protein 1-like isoform X3 [Durio zibethinus]|uniref:Oxidation resistance protein 1-like isoform X3 n=1 Tax=Durio zibethinus TaxID=66656 RepID=A0A6P5X405_DURZI|nr:oxidation resistance protein 1-like isoform X3 [Durio zibethinus]
MYTLKDKVAGSLSSLFADSPNHSSPSSSDLSQARWYSKGTKSVSSIFSHIIPSVSFGGSKLNDHGSDLKPIQSLPVRWKNKKFEVQNESLDSCKEYIITYANEDLKKVCEDRKKIWTDSDNKQTDSPHSEDKDRSSEKSSSDSDEFQEAREQQSPGSTLKHGISLRTLIRKSTELPGPCLLITGDRQGAVFGAMLECPLKPTPKRKYQGTNQTFVFTTIYGEPRLFRATGANRYYYICLNDLLALGGGGNFALSLDGDLLSGTSGPCETFGNLCLAHKEDFELKNVELWGFKHASQYFN